MRFSALLAAILTTTYLSACKTSQPSEGSQTLAAADQNEVRKIEKAALQCGGGDEVWFISKDLRRVWMAQFVAIGATDGAVLSSPPYQPGNAYETPFDVKDEFRPYLWKGWGEMVYKGKRRRLHWESYTDDAKNVYLTVRGDDFESKRLNCKKLGDDLAAAPTGDIACFTKPKGNSGVDLGFVIDASRKKAWEARRTRFADGKAPQFLYAEMSIRSFYPNEDGKPHHHTVIGQTTTDFDAQIVTKKNDNGAFMMTHFLGNDAPVGTEDYYKQGVATFEDCAVTNP